jgi:UDP-GlcNAc:undecaprenyl-phosphate GlcNAc-1-phosphate transferase
MYSLFALACLSFALSLLLTPLVRNLCRRYGLVDHPGERKVHQNPIPRAGGVAIASAYVGAYCLLLIIGLKGGIMVWSARTEIWRLLPAAVSIFLIGLADDLRGLKPSRKVIGEVGASVLAYTAGVHFTGLGGHTLPDWASLPLTIAWLLLCTNAVNLIDGIDGLATGVGFFATVTMALAALMQGNITLAIAVVPLAGALLGFLRYNFNPATIFLGDSGSLFVGFLLGCYGLLWSQKSATILGMTAPLMALAIPLLDTSLAIVRRFVHNKPIFTADRGHIHHRLLDRGMTPRKAALLLYGCCAIGAICSLGMMNTNMSGVVLIVFCAVTWIGVQHLGYIEFGTAGRMFMEGAFRRQLSSQVAIQSFDDQLKAAVTPEECWAVIQAASHDFGFHYISLCLAGQVFEHTTGIDLERCWTLRVPLSRSDFIEIAREFGHKDHCLVISPFLETLHKTLVPKISNFERYSRLLERAQAAS